MYTKAAEPIRIGTKLVKNRVTFAPTVKFDWTDGTGIAIDRFRRHYEDRAKGGAGLICVEATCVEPEGRLSPTQLGLWEDGQIPGHRAITDACHQHGAVMLVQLHHAGAAVHPECGPAMGPSAGEFRGRTCGELSRERIKEIIAAFVAAAVRAKAAGYDGVQLHGCHGYLINQFISPVMNKREDEYGGSVENRARFGCEILRGIREACGTDFLLSVRHSAAETTLGESCAIAEEYVRAGADYLQISDGIGPSEVDYPEGCPYNRVCWMGIQVHEHFKGRVPVSVVNGILTPEQARSLIDGGLADTVDSARALLADPNWARAVTEGADCVPCRSCRVCFWSPFMPHRCPAVKKRREADPDCCDYTEDDRPIPEFVKKGS